VQGLGVWTDMERGEFDFIRKISKVIKKSKVVV